MGTSEILRSADEDDVIAALKYASFGAWPEDEAGLLEFFHCMLDTMLGAPTSDGNLWLFLSALQ
jgi:hypothetical protein